MHFYFFRYVFWQTVYSCLTELFEIELIIYQFYLKKFSLAWGHSLSKTFLIQAIQLSQTVLIKKIQFSLSIVFVHTQLNVKTILYQTIQFNISKQFSSIWPIDRILSGATKSGPKWNWERWQWRGTLHSTKLQHYWNLIIRLFSVISRRFVGEGVCCILVSKKRKHRFGHLWVVDIKGGSDYFSVYIHSLDYLHLVH